MLCLYIFGRKAHLILWRHFGAIAMIKNIVDVTVDVLLPRKGWKVTFAVCFLAWRVESRLAAVSRPPRAGNYEGFVLERY